jgi:hypothetical protein
MQTTLSFFVKKRRSKRLCLFLSKKGGRGKADDSVVRFAGAKAFDYVKAVQRGMGVEVLWN